MLTQLIRLLLAMAAAWAALIGPAYLVGGLSAVVGMTAAVLICLLPGMVVLVLQSGPLAKQPPLGNLVVAMGLRLVFVLAAVLIVRQTQPDLPAALFLAWLVPTYLVALTVETRLALAQSLGHGKTPAGMSPLHVTPAP